MQEEEFLHQHNILQQNLKCTNKLITKDGQIKKKIAKQFTEYKCKVCNKTFTDKSNLATHEKIHTLPTYQCPECPYRGKTQKYLTRHRKKAHSEPTAHKCSVCGKMFHFESKLREHSMVHTGEKPHKCGVCGKAFRVTFSLNAHMLIHTNEKPFKCAFCEFACRDSSSLRKHENRHMGVVKVFPCKLCPKKFPDKAKLKYHVSDYHLNYLDSGQNKYACEYCGTKVKSKNNLKKHIQAVHDKSLHCECPVCGQRVSNKNNLPAHLRSHFAERPYACTFDDCNKRFKDKGTLKKHVIIHQPHLQHSCRECGALFARARRLVSHMRVHQPRDKCVQCDYCGVKFYTKNYLIKHITQKHTRNKKKFKCDNCGLVTYNKPSIVMHLKYGHCNVEDLSCKICKTKYKLYEYLKSHYLKTHKIRYKPMKKRFNKKKERKPTVQIKVEPLDPEELFEEEIHIIDVPKEEIVEEDPELDNDSVTYSKTVLSEDLADCIIEDRGETTERSESNFDAFLYKHVFHKQVKLEEQVQDDVNEEERSYVTEKVKEIIKVSRTETVRKRQKQAKVLKGEEQDTLPANELRHGVLMGRETGLESRELEKERVCKQEKKPAGDKRNDKEVKSIKFLYEKFTEESNAEELTDEANHVHAANSEQLNGDSHDVMHHRNDSSNDAMECKVTFHKDVCNAVKFDKHPNDSLNENTENLNKTTFDRATVTISDDEIIEHEISGTSNTIPKASTNKLHNNDIVENQNETVNDNDSETSDDDLGVMERKKRLEVKELEKVRQIYNQRMKIAAEKGRNKQPEKAIKYFKQKKSEEGTAVQTDETNNKESLNDKTIDNVLININDLSKDGNNTNKEIADSNVIVEDRYKNTESLNENLDSNSVASTNDKSGISDVAIIKDNVDNNTNANDLINNTINSENVSKDSISDSDTNDDSNEEINNKSDDDSNYKPDSEDESTGKKKLKFKTHQCYVCFKLYSEKEDLMSHCESHFAICNTTTLAKCPCCGHVTSHHMAKHMWDKHQIRIRIPYSKITQREDSTAGSKYCYRMDKEGNLMEIIPSVKMLNHDAAIQIDRRNRERKDTTIAKTKLVRKGREWVVENETVAVSYNQLPEFTEQELSKLKVSTNYVDRLGQLGKLAKKKGIKMVFPCNGCDKICRNFSGLKLHSRRHDPNKKPFAPKKYSYNQWKQKKTKPTIPTNKPEVKDSSKMRLDNRFAKPKPIKNNHKCDEKLKKFYETHIRGADIEFWQFLKIFNKMSRENIQDFKDFEGRTDFGHHGYLDENFKDPLNSAEISVTDSAKEADDVSTQRDLTNTQRDENVTNSNKEITKPTQREKVTQTTQRRENVTEGTQRRENVTEGTQRRENVTEGTRRRENVTEGTQRRENITEGTQRRENVTEGTQRREKTAALNPAFAASEWTQTNKDKVNLKTLSAIDKRHNNTIRKPYVRVIRISRKQHLAREKAKIKLREKFAKRNA